MLRLEQVQMQAVNHLSSEAKSNSISKYNQHIHQMPPLVLEETRRLLLCIPY